MKKTAVSLLLEFTHSVEDYRKGNRLHYPSSSIIFITFIGILCGAKQWDEIVEVGESCEKLLKEYLREEYVGVPSHDTFSRFFSLVSPESMEKAFRQTMQKIRSNHVSEEASKEVIAIDGKYMNGVKGSESLNIVSAFATSLGLSLGQKEAEKKMNEPEVLRQLLSELDLKDCIITADALHCQKESAKRIIEAKADYVLVVKKNQRKLHNAILEGIRVENIRDKKRSISHEEVSIEAHGRIDNYVCHSCSLLGWLPQVGTEWEGIKSFGTITRESTDLSSGEKSIETRCFISSLPMNAEDHLKWLRKHWLIENHLHWQLDVTFQEDQSRMKRVQSKNISLLRKLALPALKSFEYKKHSSLKNKMFAAAFKPEIRRKLIDSALEFFYVS